MRVNIFYPVRFYRYGAAYACMQIADGMHCSSVDVNVIGTSSNDIHRPLYYKSAVPHYLERIVYKFCSEEFIKKIAEFRYLKTIKTSDVAYLWPAVRLELFHKLKDAGHFIIMENINTHQAGAKRILDEAYRDLGLPLTHGITDIAIERENAMLVLADFVFSPSSCVTDSLRQEGVSVSKILESSYGLRESDRYTLFQPSKSAEKIKFIFAGRIGIRKGAHFLLDYWCKANIKGELILVGNIEESARPLVEPYFKRPDIKHIGFVSNLIETMRQADVFVLPSLEEGSPLVTYDAIGQGLPCIVTPMGGGGIIKHGKTGFVLEVTDQQGWIDAFRTMEEDCELRSQMAYNAWQDSLNYIWPTVAKQRRDLLLDKLAEKSS